MRAVFRAAAAEDIGSAFTWYERQRGGLGDDFLAHVASTVDIVMAHPEAWPLVHRDVRRAMVLRYPYGLLYRVLDDVVVFVGCFHTRRHPRVSKGRF
jgi:hypothetical protein